MAAQMQCKHARYKCTRTRIAAAVRRYSRLCQPVSQTNTIWMLPRLKSEKMAQACKPPSTSSPPSFDLIKDTGVKHSNYYDISYWCEPDGVVLCPPERGPPPSSPQRTLSSGRLLMLNAFMCYAALSGMRRDSAKSNAFSILIGVWWFLERAVALVSIVAFYGLAR